MAPTMAKPPAGLGTKAGQPHCRAVKRPDFLDEAWVERNTAEFTEAAMAIAAQPASFYRRLVRFRCHLVDLTTLFVLFLAFHQKVHFGVLVAGYAMGILFWIVSITPQGIGVVEGMMTLVFASLGVPIERATVIALAFRGLTFWLPLGIGFIMLRRLKSFGARESSPDRGLGCTPGCPADRRDGYHRCTLWAYAFAA